MLPRWGELGRARLWVGLLRLTVGEAEPYIPIAEKHGHGCGMFMHDRLLVGTVVNLEHPHVLVLQLDRVVLGIYLDWVLGHRVRDHQAQGCHHQRKKSHLSSLSRRKSLLATTSRTPKRAECQGRTTRRSRPYILASGFAIPC